MPSFFRASTALIGKGPPIYQAFPDGVPEPEPVVASRCEGQGPYPQRRRADEGTEVLRSSTLELRQEALPARPRQSSGLIRQLRALVAGRVGHEGDSTWGY